MPEPTTYSPSDDFTATDKGPQLNVELSNVAEATGSIAAALADIRRSDGALQNGIVTEDSLAAGLKDELANGAISAAAASASAAAGSATAAATSASEAGAAATAAANAAVAEIVADVEADAAAAAEDALATAGDRVQTGLDRAATAADVVSTGADVVAAAAAQASAEAARDAAFVNANVYADIATGRAAVADGVQFQVVSGDEIIRYRRDTSTTQTEMARYPSGTAFNDLIDQVGPLSADALATESSYLWGVSDADGNLLVGVGADGGLQARIAPSIITGTSDMPDETGYSVAWSDAESNLLLGIRSSDGKVIAPAGFADLAELNAVTNGVACYGDSLTSGGHGGGGVTFPAIVAAELDRATFNRGIGSQRSGHIAARQGGLVLDVTISGNEIVSGANSVTAFNGVAITPMSSDAGANQPLSSAGTNGPRSIDATIGGISGILQRTASGGPPSTSEVYTFTPDAGQILPKTCPPRTPIILSDQGDQARINVFWVGRNDTWLTTEPQDNVELMARLLIERGNFKFVVLPVFNGNYGGEFIGEARYDQMQVMNRAMQKRFPANFLDVRRYLIDRGLEDAGITPTAQDLIDIGRDTIPQSLRSDLIHLNDTGYTLVGQQVAAFIASKEW